MSIEPIEPIGSSERVEPPSVVDGPWWPSTVDAVGATDSAQAPQAPLAVRDPRADALNIAQHATAFIPAPVLPTWDDLQRRRRR